MQSGSGRFNRGLLIIALVLVILIIFSKVVYGEEAREYTDDEVYMLSHLICGESEGCGWDMKISVGSVVLNRIEDERFPDTMAEVIFQEGQYSCTWDGNYYREPSKETIEAAIYLLENGPAIDESVVWQAEFPQGNGVYDTIGNQYFCY